MTISWRLDGWQPWGPEAFTRARETGRPVLLAVLARWSAGSVRMVETSYRDPDVRAILERAFVPVWVDADDRPDVADRYELGGWPTTAFLTPDGRVLGGQTFTEAAPLAALLRRVADAFRQRRDELLAPAASDEPPATAVASGPPAVEPGLEGWLGAHLLEAYDPTHGGFGRAAKRLHEAPIRVALEWRHAGGDDLRAVAAHTLTAASALVDTVDGGMFRYAARRDWSAPSTEKLATVNAEAARAFLDGWWVLRDEHLRDVARSLVDYLRGTLMDASDGRVFCSQPADEDYYDRSPEARARLDPPVVDRRVYASGSAEVARSLIRAADLLEDPSLLAPAVAALDRLVADVYEGGQGLAHRVGDPDTVRGLLLDHVAVSEALLEAHAATDMEVYLDLAHELMLHALRVLWHPERRVFVDRVVGADDIGLLRRTIAPFGLNCRASAVLAHLARRRDQPELLERARQALAGQARGARARSVEAASYVTALAEVSGSS